MNAYTEWILYELSYYSIVKTDKKICLIIYT